MSLSRSGSRSESLSPKGRLGRVSEIESESQLIARVQDGDVAAFEQLYRHYALALEDFAFHYVSSRDAAKDIVQETFYRVWEQHERWTPDSIEAYLFGAVRNRSFKILRRERRARAYRGISMANGTSPAMGRSLPDGDEAVRRAEIVLAFTLALSKLPERARAAAKLRWFDGLSRHEIARTLDIAERTVGSHLVRASRFMRSALSLFES